MKTKAFETLMDITYPLPGHKSRIENRVGRSIPFIKRLKMKGIGSGRVEIKNHSSAFEPLLNENNDINYTNIELRKSGIVIGVNSVLRRYIWMIPFSSLDIQTINNVIRYSDGSNWMELKSDKMSDLLAFNKKIEELSNQLS